MYRILFAASEAYPLVKTGGLGDVMGSLPAALAALDCDVRLVLPGYRDVLESVVAPLVKAEFTIPETGHPVRLLETTLPGSDVVAWLVDCPSLYGRGGDPYNDEHNIPWPDTAQRFALLCRAVHAISLGIVETGWLPQIVHCNDWQTGLIPALLSQSADRPATVFTIHNLAYQGVFPYDTFVDLKLPEYLWSPDGLEFYEHLSFIKGGLIFSDRITTVSPTYAREIQSAEFGAGLDGLLHQRSEKISGILNGIDEQVWDPAHDEFIVAHYDADNIDRKAENKQSLQKILGLQEKSDKPLIAFVHRLTDQKGVDLVIDALPELAKLPVQLAILGTGNPNYEQQLVNFAEQQVCDIAVRIGYSEPLSHQMAAGADFFLMPSRFEPCGLAQIHNMRYGTIPIVRSVGGLADTVTDTNPQTIAAGTATGIVIDGVDAEALVAAIRRALEIYHQPYVWSDLLRSAMRGSYSWRDSVDKYLELYQSLLASSR